MATRIAIADGNLTAAGTWAEADATSLLVSSANNTTLTTSYVSSSTFTPGAIEIDGIAVWVNTRPGSTGTISAALDQATTTVPGTEVTIDVADIPADGNCWVLFKFAAPVTLLAATAYSVKARTSNATQVNLFRNATANNWSRLLRTTTTGAPAAADPLYVLGEKTGSGAQTARTVTMDDAAAGATVYGQIDVSAGGTMTFGTTAATNYFLKIAGDFNVRAGGTLNIGTSGTPMPSDSTAVLEFNCGSNVQFGLLVKAGGTIECHGHAITNVKALLNADASGGATSITTDISTGWKNGDEIALASTTQTASQCEKKTLSGDAVTTTLPIAALASAHSGTAPTQAELINLTRNVKIRGVSTSLQAYIVIENGSSCTWRYTEMYQLGANDSIKQGMRFNSASSSSVLDVQFCSWHDFVVSLSGVRVVPASTINCNIVFSHNVSFSISRTHLEFADAAMGAGSVTCSDHVAIRVTSSSMPVIETNIAEMTMTNVVVAGGAASGDAQLIIAGGGGVLGTFQNLTAHSGGFSGIAVKSGIADGNTLIENLTAWRNSAGGLIFGETGSAPLIGVNVTGTNQSFGNSTSSRGNMSLLGRLIDCSFGNFVCNGGAGFPSSFGLQTESGGAVFCEIINCRIYDSTFGVTVAHTTADLYYLDNGAAFVQLLFDNCLLASPTEINPSSAFRYPGTWVRFQRLDQTSGGHKSLQFEGNVTRDSAIFDVSPSVRLTPTSATRKLELAIRRKQAANGAAVTISVKVRCSVIGDGAAYNGNRPRLIVKAAHGCGISSDTILDTATVASDGAFETLTGTTVNVTDDCVLTFVVDCDGTAGWVNVDTLSVS